MMRLYETYCHECKAKPGAQNSSIKYKPVPGQPLAFHVSKQEVFDDIR